MSSSRVIKVLKMMLNREETRELPRSGERTAIYAASRYARVPCENMKNLKCIWDGTLYEVAFKTSWMEYDCFVDPYTGVLCGFDATPVRY